MKTVDEPESIERRSLTALLTLLRTVDPESLLPYTAMREIEAMAGERVLIAVEALRAETRAEFKALRAETRGEFKAIKTVIASNAAAIASNAAAIAANTQEMRNLLASQSEMKGEIKEMKGEMKTAGATYQKMLWVLIGLFGTTLASALVALYVQAFGN